MLYKRRVKTIVSSTVSHSQSVVAQCAQLRTCGARDKAMPVGGSTKRNSFVVRLGRCQSWRSAPDLNDHLCSYVEEVVQGLVEGFRDALPGQRAGLKVPAPQLLGQVLRLLVGHLVSSSGLLKQVLVRERSRTTVVIWSLGNMRRFSGHTHSDLQNS